ncbi:putative deacetylvindoline O-acetyltransferase [Helianthus annuus]|uniref:Deacetylvindoline O-acetyltransferase n=1 Tax=Helianthus annuus TaxID=4232 RepID=A0A251VIU1_HELAN|nr:tabersonine-19-hydroxy-O-acetyltransferase [Helianthus annuus]KAF5818762.1 putative deacetylvindoline O-acetyltransferase [Helianthus annuus]KAJ0604999.1 putative deacetylvindoline O-acetyltransferase [Helianthus annuus]KAJ0619013.1 putative deacetylvindoline O-acetyltransferase [Helianthus annuus]KAJ0777467.1 putative deacetylvindoline O-acetyltransferase [Helianthus annuus]KAJ0952068.1 putative deacetylvindoline O-acetyltransferase [Helianthus annuus]
MIGKILRFGRRQHHTIISREIIKPSSPTTSHLRTYNLSYLDQGIPHMYMPLILFYPNNENCSLTADYKVQKLKKSLSQTLTRYYPFAGRLHTPTTPYVDCNDEEVVFVEAKHDSQLHKFQHTIEEEDETVGQLFADDMVWIRSPHSTSLVGVQLNHFACGGIGLAVSMSHKICDGCTLGSYMNYWASVARCGSTDHKEVLPLNPHFIQSPTTTNPINPLQPTTQIRCAHFVTRKFIFPNSKLSDLKNKVSSINSPTRFEVLSSLIYKTVVAATTQRSSSFTPYFLAIPVDVRNHFVPKLPQTTVGNFLRTMLVATRHESETSLSVLVSEIRKEKMEVKRVRSWQLTSQSLESVMSRIGVSRSFWCSSLCGFPYSKVDFGWGNPTVASVTFGALRRNGCVLMDTPNGDGILARVTLDSLDMEVFQNDKELLSFCKIN